MNDIAIYQSAAETSLLSNISIPDAHECPHIALIVSPCRSGSTALLQCFASQGYLSYFQPMKRILRWQIVGQSVDNFVIPVGSEKRIIIKETLGPYFCEESEMNPIRILIKKGYPIEKISLILLLRDPLQTFSSWMATFGQNKFLPSPTFETFKAAYSNTYRMKEEFEEVISVMTLTPDSLCQKNRLTKISELFKLAHLPLHGNPTQWEENKKFGSPMSMIIKEKEPDSFRIPGVYDTLKEALKLSEPKPRKTPITNDDFTTLYQMYTKFGGIQNEDFDGGAHC
jgi:hypothetical protein